MRQAAEWRIPLRFGAALKIREVLSGAYRENAGGAKLVRPCSANPYCLLNEWGEGRSLNAVPVRPTCKKIFVRDFGWVRFHGWIKVYNIAAEGLSAGYAVDDASTQERLVNPSKTAGAIVLHG